MELQFTPYIFLTLLAAIISAIIASAIWRRRPGPGVNAFVVMMGAVTLWTLCNTVELSMASLLGKIIAINIVYLAVVTVPASYLLFALSYTGREEWVKKHTIVLLAIMPALTMLTIITNDLHNLFWLTRDTAMQDGLVVTNFGYAPLFWVHTGYSYAITLIGVYILLRAVIRSPQLYRGQMGLMILGATTPLLGNFLFISALNPLPDYVDATAFAFALAGLPVGWALYRFRLMDIVPVAREIIFDNMVDGVLVVDSESRIVDINTAAIRILGLKSSNVVGKSLINVWEKQRALLLQFSGVENANTEVEIEVDGELRTYNVRVSPLKNRRGELTGRIANLHDISTLKTINRELEVARQKADEATRLKSDFLATMSHELRTPLNAVIGYTELMLTGMVGELAERHYQYTDRVLSNAKYLLNLINDILDISKIEAGRMDLVMQAFDLRQWAADIDAQNRVLAEEKGLAFNIEIDEQLPQEILGDSARLRQIAINLLSNAFKFTHEGHVTCKINKHDKTTWSIIVSDTGIGIAPHKQETIFDEFQQVDSSSTREYGGTGLGLAIVRRFVLMMGGHIRVSSTLDEGSTFTIILPLITELPKQATMKSGMLS